MKKMQHTMRRQRLSYKYQKKNSRKKNSFLPAVSLNQLVDLCIL